MTENLVIPELFSQAVSEFPDKVALQIKQDNQWQRFTYRDLEEYSLKVATFLVKQGWKKSDTASLILENRPEWAIIYLGVVQAGLVCVPLDPQLNQEDLKNLVLDSAAKIIFCSFDVFTKKIKDNLQTDAIKIVVLDMPDSQHENVINFSALKDIPSQRNVMPKIVPQDIASLIYTSGTTGEPKGALLSHANICANFQSIVKLNICSSADNVISILPLYHTYAFMVTLMVPLFLGATVTFDLSFKPQEINQIVKEANITVLVGIPQLFSILHKIIFERIKKIPFLFLPLALLFIRIKVRRQWSNLRLLVSGGARLEPKVGRDLSKILGIKLIEGYGLTETSPVVTLNPPENLKLGSVGKPIPDVQIKILRPDRKGIGEVLIRGPNLMQGYFKHPDWTQEAIKEGWFYSGDLGYIDSEGYLFLVGREKEVIVLSSGKNIYPEELEEYYSKSPYIKEICILGRIEEKFGRSMELLHAIIVPNLEYFQQRNETNIRGKIRWELENLGKDLTNYKHIMGFTVTKEKLPRTTLKKIKRYQVREEYLGQRARYDIKEAGLSEEDLKILTKDVAKKIIQYLCSQVKKPVYLDSHLEIDLGIDSLSRVELGLGLESLFSVNIPDSVLYTISTVKDAIMKVSEIIEKAEQPEIYETKVTQGDVWSQVLREPPKEEILKKIRIEVRLLDLLLTWLFKNLFSFIFRICWLLKTRGKEYLPKKGPFIICPNHASYLDGFIVFSALPLKLALNTYFLGYSAIFEHPLIRWAIKLARLIPIDPNIHLTDAMQALSSVISQKKIVCIFPEGHRSIDENIEEFKKGVAILIKELDIPVVPVYIKGSHQSWPRGLRLPRFYPLKIIFGPLFLAKELLEKREYGVDDYEAVAKGLRQEVLKLAC